VCLKADVSINDKGKITLYVKKKNDTIWEQNFADAKTRYEVATSSRRFFSFEIVARLRALSSRTPFGKTRMMGSRASSRSVDFDDSTPPTKGLSCQTRCKHRRYSHELSSGRRRSRCYRNWFSTSSPFYSSFLLPVGDPRPSSPSASLPLVVTSYNCDLYLSFM